MNYTITFEKEVVVLNNDLIKKQGIDEEAIAEILGLHAKKLALFKGMSEAEEFSLSAYGREIRNVEYALQRAWNFSQNAAYHRFWLVPRCTCPQMDNEDSYGAALYYINKKCPVHGEEGYA